jgi:2'-5' RNA ligase
MPRADVYSLWIMPEDDVYSRLSSTIRQLSKPYGTPEFEPHVTVIGTLTGDQHTLIEKIDQLAATMQPFDTKLRDIDYLNEYFRCLFIRIEQSAAVMGANTKARTILDQSRSADYMPHLSLMYGDIDAVVKKAIIQTIGKDLHCTFPVTDIHLYATGGAPERWYKVKSFHLG